MWDIIRTETFLRAFKKYKKNKDFVGALEKKIQRLQEDPHTVGGELSGRLHGLHSTRLLKNFRLLFRIEEQQRAVFLLGFDHRKFGYERFYVAQTF